MVVNVVFVVLLFIFSCNGVDVRGDLASSDLLNIGGYLAASKPNLSPANALNQPSVASQGLDSLTSLIANGGSNYIIDASALGRGLLIAKNGNIAPLIATQMSQFPSLLTNQKNSEDGATAIANLLQGFREKSAQNSLKTLAVPNPYLKTQHNSVKTKLPKQLIPANSHASSQEAINNLRLVPSPNLSLLPTNSITQAKQNPLKLPVSSSGITKLAPVNVPQYPLVPLTRAPYFQLPNYSPLALRPYTDFAIPISNFNAYTPILRAIKTVSFIDDDGFY